MLFTSCNNQLPKIKSISHTKITYDMQVTIIGNGFSSNNCENVVKIGTIDCVVVISTSTQIVFRLNNSLYYSSYLPQKLNVLVNNIGYATYETEFSLSVLPTIYTVFPEAGSVSGGTDLVIFGFGFDSSTIIQLGPHFLDIIESTFTLITARTVALPQGTYDINTAFQYLNGTTVLTTSCYHLNLSSKLNCRKFTMSQNVTPVIYSVNPISLSDSGIITLIGNNFDNYVNNIKVVIGRENCTVLSANLTQVTCRVAGLSLGNNSILLYVKGRK